MDLRYFYYMLEDEKYYTKFTINDVPYILPDVYTNNKEKYELFYSDDMHWTEVRMTGHDLPIQGWKIHISSTLEESQKILDIVSKICFDKNISFKYVRTKGELKFKNTKYADRSSSGKFITIYPPDEETFISLLDTLHYQLVGFKNGPYILTDKRWRDGNVFFRYGGIKTIRDPKNQSDELYIYDNNGNLIIDDRSPFYKLPDFIEENDYIKTIESSYVLDDLDLIHLNKYEITEVLHFSNGGGVYKAIRISDEMPCIIKEGRYGAGLDGAFIDAFTRIKSEFDSLKKLEYISEVVNPIECFKEWENNYLVEEYIDGYVLDDWIRLNFPFLKSGDSTKKYGAKILKILNNIKYIIFEIHKNGISIGDLQPNNIMITLNNSVKFIDFEVATDCLKPYDTRIGTPGFMDRRSCTCKENDFISLINIAWYCFLPIGPVSSLDNSILSNHIQHIRNNFGNDIAHNLYSFIEEIANNISFGKEYMSHVSSKSNNINLSNIEWVKSKLLNTLHSDINLNSDRLVHGDIRQFETELGMYNYMYGSYGIIHTLSKYNLLTDSFLVWVKNHLDFSGFKDCGLFTGKAGIASILYEIGFKDEATSMFYSIISSVENMNNPTDISLLSGLSGIGLALIQFYKVSNNALIIKSLKEISTILEKLLNDNFNISPIEDFAPIGLLTGWSGVSYFYLHLYKLTEDEKFIELALCAIDLDLKKCKYDEALYTSYNGILSPYLLGGSAGIAICIDKFKSLNISNFEQQFNQISNNLYTTNFYGVGLFRGVGSMIILSNYNRKSHCLEKSLSLLELFFVFDKNRINVPGEFSYKYSNDVFSGTAGLLLALCDMYNPEKNSWIPLIHT